MIIIRNNSEPKVLRTIQEAISFLACLNKQEEVAAPHIQDKIVEGDRKKNSEAELHANGSKVHHS